MRWEELRNFVKRYLFPWHSLYYRCQRKETRRFKDYFDTIENHPLTEKQRQAIILDERRSLVVAGAGTGKTSVIVSKVGYLLKSKKCKPHEILLLAFNADAAKELRERCKTKLGEDVRAETFHGLGYQILKSVEPVAPTLSVLSTDQKKFSEFIDRFILELKSDAAAWKKARPFVLGHLRPHRPEAEFTSLQDYEAFIKAMELRALSGDLVKSFAELDIANFLFFNGVRFHYEKRYPGINEAYQPDFYLPDQKIWIEHFGIDRKGNTAPYIDQKKYRQEMEWKRQLHQQNSTPLLETYSWQRSEGSLTKSLHDSLKEHGVTYRKRSDEEIFEALQRMGYISRLSVLLGSFLTHFKSNQMGLQDIHSLSKNARNRKRSKLFLEVFARFHERYQEELAKPKPPEVDFNDMISLATRHIREGRSKTPWRYFIVDEFQDISKGRYLLLDAMLKASRGSKFFAVGDDWQSIYRFAGSDISIMTKFRKFFGRATIVKLDQTFRFNNSIAATSGKFVQKNPAQIRKSLLTFTKTEEPKVFMHPVIAKEQSRQTIKAKLIEVACAIAKSSEIKGQSLQVLSRYNHLLPDAQGIHSLKEVWDGEVKIPLTIHRSKGLQADIVFVLGLLASEYGFPSEIEDDPLLNLVLSEPEIFPDAEERRLMYVAMTRAKHETHLFYDAQNPSSFAIELMQPYYQVDADFRADQSAQSGAGG